MRCPNAIPNEHERILALSEYGLGPDVDLPSLYPVVEIAAKVFGTPAAAVNMIGSDRVFFAASTGIGECDMGRDVSFCAHAITQDGVMVVEDAALDPRFHDNPLVTEGLIRFYAGVPLRAPSGHALGALCVVDSRPRTQFDEQDRARLKDLASMAADKLELRRLEVANIADEARPRSSGRPDRKTLNRLTYYDSLTGLPNRKLLMERIGAAFEGAQPPSIVTIDIDRFKDINNTLGAKAGDAVLCQIARRLETCIGGSAFVARIGGDEFAILVTDPRGPLGAAAQAEAAAAALAEPIVVEAQEVRVSGSFGLAMAPMHGANAEDLLANSGLALFQAKTEGPGRSFVYVPALRAEASARRMYDAELHRATERGEFLLYYQPQFRIVDGVMVGAEALLRWKHPMRNILQPAAFIPALERNALAPIVGDWVLEAACAQAAEWRKAFPGFRMGVNLFGAQFHAGDLPARIAHSLTRHGLPAEALELEITENIALDQADKVLPQLEAIRATGVQLAFDDFGTGYASLNVLNRYPITRIKIDRSFIEEIVDPDRDYPVVSTLIDLSRRLGLKIIAEGVETGVQKSFLAAAGCQEGQGYLFGRPVPADVFEDKFGLTPTGALQAAG